MVGTKSTKVLNTFKETADWKTPVIMYFQEVVKYQRVLYMCAQRYKQNSHKLEYSYFVEDWWVSLNYNQYSTLFCVGS